jgi:hypothetical protein
VALQTVHDVIYRRSWTHITAGGAA